jgi:hypothetical protein
LEANPQQNKQRHKESWNVPKQRIGNELVHKRLIDGCTLLGKKSKDISNARSHNQCKPTATSRQRLSGMEN